MWIKPDKPRFRELTHELAWVWEMNKEFEQKTLARYLRQGEGLGE